MSNIKQTNYKILQYFMQHYKWPGIALLAIQFGTGLLEGLGVAALLPLIDTLINNSNQTQSTLNIYVSQFFTFLNLDLNLSNILLLVTGLFFSKAILRYFGALYVSELTSKIVMDFREKLVQTLLKSQWSFYIKNPTGHFINALMIEAQRSGGTFRTMADIFASLLQMLILTIIAALASWQVMVAGLCASIFLWGALHRFIKQAGQAGLAQKDTSKIISAQIADLLQNYKPLKAMHIESHVFSNVQKHISDLYHISKKQIMAKQSMDIFHEPLFIMLFSLGIYTSITFLQLETATLMVFAAIFYRFITAWRGLQQGYQVLAGQQSFFWSYLDFINEAEQEKEIYTQSISPSSNQDIIFKNVNFAHQDKLILSNLNLTFPARKLIGLCGPSGTGKTTIVDLLCRLYTPQSGAIIAGTTPIENIDLYQWRDHLGYIPQEFVIFNESLLNNITLGNPNMTQEQVIYALKQAEAWEFVKDLPDGLQTNLGERGGKLSGGQRQRISIARALVRKPNLLIMDEATASLDKNTELEIFKTLKKLTDETTIIVISHQRAIKEWADVVIDLGNNKTKV